MPWLSSSSFLLVAFALVGSLAFGMGYKISTWRNQATIGNLQTTIANYRADMRLAQSVVDSQAKLLASEAAGAQEKIDELAATLKEAGKRLADRPMALKTVLETRPVFVESVVRVCDPADPDSAGMPQAPGGDDPQFDSATAAAQADIDRAWDQAAACIGTLRALNNKSVTIEIVNEP